MNRLEIFRFYGERAHTFLRTQYISDIAHEVFDELLAESTELNAVKHTPQNSCGVSNVFLVAKMDIIYPQKLRMASFVYGCYSKRAACAGGR